MRRNEQRIVRCHPGHGGNTRPENSELCRHQTKAEERCSMERNATGFCWEWNCIPRAQSPPMPDAAYRVCKLVSTILRIAMPAYSYRRASTGLSFAAREAG